MSKSKKPPAEPARLPGRPRVHDLRVSVAMSTADRDAIAAAARAAGLTFSEFCRLAAVARACEGITLNALAAGEEFEADEEGEILRGVALAAEHKAPKGVRAIVNRGNGHVEYRPATLAVRRIRPA